MKYNKTIIKSVIDKLTKSIDSIKSEIDRVSSIISSLEEDWKGVPSNYIAGNMRKSLSNFNSYVESLFDYKRELEKLLEEINKTEINATQTIDNALGG